ncbi:hypothetical protein ACFQY0_15225 [Haloferula chungangensis]|uniref:Verru_Chthon cassette protein A n=1 Tax=Haloferula chungangensis TaxID=1048331 RepID=A0ABW2LAP5_9BACT
MKTPALKPGFFARRVARNSNGFALIITISMMILLALLAVGLLSLSTVAIRSSKQSDAMAVARANARLGLMMAIGDLQKFAGPDQRITARADVLDENIANPRLTGVWESWDIDAKNPPSPAEYEEAQRNEKFLGWLSSSKDGKSAQEVDFARSAPTEPATLWGTGSLGDNPDVKDIVQASKVPMGSDPGAVAWAVMDEGVKARINTPFKISASTEGGRTTQLGSGQRPNSASIPGLAKLEADFFEEDSESFNTITKGISRKNMELAVDELATGTGENLKPLTHAVSISSVGLLTDTAKGGLKQDFSLLTNDTELPSPYERDLGVYATLLDLDRSAAPSDPTWGSLHELARLPLDTSALTARAGSPVLRASVPSNWTAATGSNPSSGEPGVINREPPSGMTLLPTVARVQVVFSLLTRDIYNYPKVTDTTPKPQQTQAQEQQSEIHGPWGKRFAGSSYDYLLHLLYTPVITLHNPYNVTLEFRDLKVVFGNVPFGLKVIRNGVAQTRDFAPLDKMYYQQAEQGKINKRFGMTLKTNGGTTDRPRVGSSTFRMLPGEVILFSPYIDPEITWNNDANGTGVADWRGGASDKTMNIDGIPGWRGDGIGFDLDWFCPADIRVDTHEREGTRAMEKGGVIAARAEDEFMVQFAPISVPTLSDNKFTVEIFGRTSGSQQISSSIIELDYGNPTGLQDALMGSDGYLSYPSDGSTINTMEMHSHSKTKIKENGTIRPFAIVSANAKTTSGGLNADGEDGLLATKPWCFGHANIGSFSGNIVSEHSSSHSHEFSFQRLDNGTTNLLQFDYKTGRGNFISGLTGDTGTKFGVQYDVPLAPIQTLVGLNTANPGGSSGYLPRFAHPIGNSWAHPLVNSSDISTNGDTYPYLDHSFLLNLALYDRFYFSGLGEQGGRFNASASTDVLAQNFLDGEALSDPRLAPYNPDGRPSSEFVSELINEDDAYAKVAAWQVVNGAFNINSTSVTAWKAMLGSIRDANALYNQLDKDGESVGLADLPATNSSDNEARISRFRLPVSESEVDGADPIDAYWLGPREYSDAELERLAENIVEQVRERGPFLSLAEFVNRRLGTDETAQRGALQQAIDDADLNRDFANLANAGFEITQNKVSDYRYANPEAGTGPSYQGAPGYLSQADLMSVLGNAATPRSDTFTIRGYGEARDASDKILATATCEATVQRVPEYVDSRDEAYVQPENLTSEMNKTFGRRFQITSFRWLAANEI